MVTLTENIRNRRKEKGLTQRELAEALGISDKTVSRWESGVQVPDALILPDIAQVLDTTVSALYGENEEEGKIFPDTRDEMVKPAKPLIKKRRADGFKMISVIGLTITLLVTMLLCNLDIFREAVDPYNESVRSVCFYILGVTGMALIFNKTVFTLYYQKKENNLPYYLKTDISYSAPAMMIFCTIILLILPILLSVHFSLWYAAAVYLICIGCILVMIRFKWDLRKRNVLIGKKITVISLITAGMGILLFAAICVILKVSSSENEIIERTITHTTENGTLISTSRYDINNDYLHYCYCGYLLSTVPLLGALLMNMIELLIKKEKLG